MCLRRKQGRGHGTETQELVLEANLELVRRGLVLYTFGNASGIDRESPAAFPT
jgi:hypothetical protein